MSDIPKLVQLLIGELEGRGVNATRVVVDDPNPPPQMLGVDNDISASAFTTQLAAKITGPIESRLSDVSNQINNLNTDTVRQLGYMVKELREIKGHTEPEPRHILSSGGGGGGGGGNAAHPRAETFRTSFNVEDSPSRLSARRKKGWKDTLISLGLGGAGLGALAKLRYDGQNKDKDKDKGDSKSSSKASAPPPPTNGFPSNTNIQNQTGGTQVLGQTFLQSRGALFARASQLAGQAAANTPPVPGPPPSFYDSSIQAINAQPSELDDPESLHARNYLTYAALTRDLDTVVHSKKDATGANRVSDAANESLFNAREQTEKIDSLLGENDDARAAMLEAMKQKDNEGYRKAIKNIKMSNDAKVSAVESLHKSGLLEQVTEQDANYDLTEKNTDSELLDALNKIDPKLTKGQWRIKGGQTRAAMAGIKSDNPEQDVLGALASYVPTKDIVDNQTIRSKIDADTAAVVGEKVYQEQYLTNEQYLANRHQAAEQVRKSTTMPSGYRLAPPAGSDLPVGAPSSDRISDLASKGLEAEILNESALARLKKQRDPIGYEKTKAALEKKYDMSSESPEKKKSRREDFHKMYPGIEGMGEGDDSYLAGHRENQLAVNTPLIDPDTGKNITYEDVYKKYNDPKYLPFMEDHTRSDKDEHTIHENTKAAYRTSVEDLALENPSLYANLVAAATEQGIGAEGDDLTKASPHVLANMMMEYADKHNINQLHVYENLLKHAEKAQIKPEILTLPDNIQPPASDPQTDYTAPDSSIPGTQVPPIEQPDVIEVPPSTPPSPPTPEPPDGPPPQYVKPVAASGSDTIETDKALAVALTKLSEKVENAGGVSHTTVNHNKMYSQPKSLAECRSPVYRNLGMTMLG